MNVLLSSVGRRNYLPTFFRNALKGDGMVVGTNSIPDTSGMITCDVAEVTPPCFSPDYVGKMIDICQKYSIQLLFSLHDVEAPFLEKAREDFKQIGTRLVIASSDFLSVCLDKRKTTQFALQNGLVVPRTYDNIENALKAITLNEISYPLVVKPACGYGSLGLYFAEDERDLLYFYEKSSREVTRRIRDYSSYAVDLSFLDQGVLIQEIIEGQEYGIDVVNDLEGNYVATFVEKKLAMRGGETDSAVIIEDASLLSLGKKISSYSQHPANLDIDVIVRAGTPYLIEMNPRFGGHYPFAHLAGADVPSAIIAWASGKIPDESLFRPKVGFKATKSFNLLEF